MPWKKKHTHICAKLKIIAEGMAPSYNRGMWQACTLTHIFCSDCRISQLQVTALKWLVLLCNNTQQNEYLRSGQCVTFFVRCPSTKSLWFLILIVGYVFEAAALHWICFSSFQAEAFWVGELSWGCGGKCFRGFTKGPQSCQHYPRINTNK